MAMRILSIDGGGIRGIVPGQILVSLEEKLKQKSGDQSARIGNYFDLFAGTSTGAILSAAYICPGLDGKPKFSAQEAVNFYLEDGDEIFDVGFWRSIGSLGGLNDEKYSADELERVLEEAFGDVKLSELLKPTCLVSYDVSRRKPLIFKQHSALEKNRDFLVRDALRGSTASLGTGKKLKSYTYSEIKDWGPLGWAKPSIDIALEGGPQMTEYYLKQVASTVKKSKFYRIQPELYEADTSLDNATPENLESLRDAGIRNAEAFDAQLEEIAEILING